MSTPDSQVTTLDEAPPVVTAKATPKTKAAAPAPAASASGEEPEFFMVTIHPTGDEAGNEIVDISVNGYLTRIPRGVPSRVSKDVLHVLQNAVHTTYKVNGDQVVERNTPRFPFSAVPA